MKKYILLIVLFVAIICVIPKNTNATPIKGEVQKDVELIIRAYQNDGYNINETRDKIAKLFPEYAVGISGDTILFSKEQPNGSYERICDFVF